MTIYDFSKPVLAAAFCAFSLFAPAVAQKPTSEIRNPKSAAVAHFDRPFYIAGETVWFKIYLPEAVATQNFKVRFELFDEKGATRATAFLAKKSDEKGSSAAGCDGHFSIPFDLESGLFRFRFSALDSLAGPVELVAADLPIFNDLTKSDPFFTEKAVAAEPLFSNDLDLKIEVEKPAATSPLPSGEGSGVGLLPRGLAFLTLRAFEKNGQAVAATASVSIVDAALAVDPLPSPTLFVGPEISEKARFLDGIWRGGTVFLKNEKPLATPLLPVIDCETGVVHFEKTGADGHFWLRLPAFEGVREHQIFDREGRPISVVWDGSNADFGMRDAEKAAPPLLSGSGLSAQIQKILALSRQRKKIYALFGAVESEPILEKKPVEKLRPEARKSYEVQQFERFGTMAEFFREVSTIIRFEAKKDGSEARLYNTSRMTFFDATPLFLVDGRATFDADFVGKIDPATVRRVDLVTDSEVLRAAFPAIGGGGAVIVESLKGKQNLPTAAQKNVFLMPGLAPAAHFLDPKAESKKPLLSPEVFWEPSFLIDQKAEPSRLEFRQTDARGRFVIEVVARSADGKMGRARLEYSVD